MECIGIDIDIGFSESQIARVGNLIKLGFGVRSLIGGADLKGF